MRTGLSFNGAMMTWRKIKNYWYYGRYTVLYKAMDLIWKMYEELYFINSFITKRLARTLVLVWINFLLLLFKITYV